MLQNKQSIRHSLCRMTSVVVLFVHGYFDEKESYKILPETLYCEMNLNYLWNAINRMLDQISFHKHFN